MILYFDKYFILKEIINDKKIYQGGFNNQSIYVYVENCPNVAQTFIRYELFGATDENERNIITNEIEGNDIIVSKIPFDRQRDLKFFNYHDDYTFFVFNLPNGTDGNYNVLAFSGLINATIRLVTSNEVIQPLGLISFNVERSVIAEDIGISQSQYDYMITKFFGERSEILSNANLDTFFTNGIYVLNGNKVVNSPVDNPYGLLVVYSNKDYVVHNLTLENGDFYSRIGNNNNGIIDWNDWHNVDDDLSEKLDKYGGEGAELSLSDSNFYDCRICGETIIEGGIVNVGESVIDFTGGHIYADKATEENEVVNLKQLDEENEKLQKRIKQLELASEGTILSTYENVSEVSYTRLIGENVLPYGTLDKVGGMTYKSENLLNIDDFTTTKNGITYTYSKGHFTAKGTFEGVHQYNNVYFNSNQMAIMGKTKLYANKTYVLSISNAVSRKISMSHSGIAGTGYIEIGQTTKVFTTTKDFVINTINIGSNTEEEIGTSIDLEFDIWINEGTTAKPFNVYYEGLRNTKVSEVISNGANLLGFEDIEETTLNGLTYSSKNGIIYLNGKTTANTYIKIPCKLIGVGTYTSKTLEYKENGVATDAFKLAIYFRDSSDKFIIAMYDNYRQTLNITNALGAMELVFASGLAYNNVSFGISIVRGTTLPTEYKPYKAPIHYVVPSQIQALQGYGIGINETYKNYIDYDRKVFVRMVEALTINGTESNSTFTLRTSPYTYAQLDITLPLNASLNDKMLSLSNSLTVDSVNTWNYENKENTFVYVSNNKIRILFDGTKYTTVDEIKSYLQANPITIVYVLETPVETDISQYLTSDNIIEMEANGSLTFENEHKQAVPNEITYQERNV